MISHITRQLTQQLVTKINPNRLLFNFSTDKPQPFLNNKPIESPQSYPKSSASPSQLATFDKYGPWWEQKSPQQLLHSYNRLRVEFLLEAINANGKQVTKNIQNRQPQAKSNEYLPLNSLRVLDIGCGAGFFSQSVWRLGASVVGLDPSQGSFKQAVMHRSRYSGEGVNIIGSYQRTVQGALSGQEISNKPIQSINLNNLQYHNCTLETYMSENPKMLQSFDIVCAFQLLQHVSEPQKMIQMMKKCMKAPIASSKHQNGNQGSGNNSRVKSSLMMLSTIDRTPLTYLTHIILPEYLLGLVPKHTHTYQQFITRQQILSMIERTNGAQSSQSKFDVSQNSSGNQLSVATIRGVKIGLNGYLEKEYDWHGSSDQVMNSGQGGYMVVAALK